MYVFGAAAADAIDEVGVVITGSFAVRAGLDFVGQPGFVGIVAVYGEVAVGAVEDVANRVGLGVFRAEGLLLARGFFFGGLFAGVGGESRGGHAAAAIRAGADFGFVIGDPVADFQLHHFAFAIGAFENEG